MTQTIQKRVAPIIALLVIGLSLSIFFLLPRFNTNTDDTPELILDTTSDDTMVSDIVPTMTPSHGDFADEYDYHSDRGQLRLALFHLEAEANRTGWTAQAHIRAGNLWRDMGDLGRALPHWEAANLEEPNANLLRQIAAIYLERGEWSIAWERVQVLLELTPNNAWALYHGGLILAPSDPTTAFGYLGRVAVLDNDFAPVAQQVLDAMGNADTNAEIVLRVGTELARAEEWSLAENAFQYAADWYYPFAEATAYVGLMRILQGKNGDSWISEALTIDNRNPNVQYLAGIYFRSAGDFLSSENALINAIILDPTNPTYHAELGNTYRASGNYLDAEVWLQTAVALSEEDPLFVDLLEQFYQDDGFQQIQAIIGFEPEAQIAQDTDPSALSASGWAAHLQGDTLGGLALIEQALVIQPDNPRALFDKARIFLETDRVAEAIPLLQQLANGQSPFSGVSQGLLDRETQSGN